MSDNKKLLFKHDEQWDAEKLHEMWNAIEEIAKEMEIDYYPPQFEVISAEQMIDAYTSVAMPVMYKHWSFGKSFIQQDQAYKDGRMGLAYEVVINSNPSIAYLMETNSITMQALVMAHASVGHSAVFKNNYLFKMWTDASAIIDYLIYAKKYIKQCEERYGDDAVEQVLDAAHSIQHYGVDKYKRKTRNKKASERAAREIARHQYNVENYNDLWEHTIPKTSEPDKGDRLLGELEEPEENILYFIEKNAPTLPTWKREIIRIVRKIAQYFYPQSQCLTGNHMVATQYGFSRLRDLIKRDGYHENNEIKLLSADNQFADISHTYLNRKQKVVRVTTKSGRVWTATPEHPLNLLDPQTGTSTVTRIDLMNVGDYLTMNVGDVNAFSKQMVKFSKPNYSSTVKCELCKFESSYIPTHLTQTHGIDTDNYNGPLSSDLHRLNKSVNKLNKTPELLTPDVARFLAYIGQSAVSFDGVRSAFTFKSEHSEVLNDFKNLANDIFGIEVNVQRSDNETAKISFTSYELKLFLTHNIVDIEQLIAKQLYVPDCILKSPIDVVTNYLKALIDSASIMRTSVSDWRITCYDSDVEDLECINTLLISIGVVARISKSEHDTIDNIARAFGIIDGTDERASAMYVKNVLSVLNTYREAFNTKIGSVRTDLEFTRDSRIATDDIIPNGIEMFKTLRAEIEHDNAVWHSKHGANNQRIGYATSKNNGTLRNQQDIPYLGKLPQFRNDTVSQYEIKKYSDGFEYIKSNCQKYESYSTFVSYIETSMTKYYDEIVSIEYLDELQDVYDVTVPSNHLFYVDGIISHNTQVVNEGYATFTHYYIMNRLYELGMMDEGSYLEFIASHSGVITQFDYDSKYYSGFNVYTLGFNIFRDLKRMCDAPTDEDREWFPDIAGGKWQDVINNAMKNFNNETFINQFLSPKVIRDMRLFAVLDSYKEKDYVVQGIHDSTGYKKVREILSKQYNRNRHLPDISVVAADLNGDRELVLYHNDVNDVPLDEKTALQVMEHVAELWEYDVRLETIKLTSGGPANKDLVVKGPNNQTSKLNVHHRDSYFDNPYND